MTGYPSYEDYVRTPSGATSTVTANLVLLHAWEGDDRGGTYQLSFVGQTTIRPTRLQVRVTAPDGMRFTSFDPAFTLDGEQLVYDGTPCGTWTCGRRSPRHCR